MEYKNETTSNKNISKLSTKLFLGLCILLALLLIWFQLKSESGEINTDVELTGSKTGESQIKPAEMKPEEGMTLSFEKDEYNVQSEESIVVSAVGKPDGKKITAMDLHFIYDSKLLRLEKIEPSDLFSLVLSDANIDNEKGTASIAIAVPLESEASLEEGVVAKLSFVALSEGKASVSFTDKAVAAAVGEVGNVVAVKGSTLINIK